MNKEDFEQSLLDARAFKIKDSFIFAASIPDNSIGEAGSCCTNCDNELSCYQQICDNCKLPLVGPLGFLQLLEWKTLNPNEKKRLIKKVYLNGNNKGRYEHMEITDIPLNPQELKSVEKFTTGHESFLFTNIHKINVIEIRNIFVI